MRRMTIALIDESYRSGPSGAQNEINPLMNGQDKAKLQSIHETLLFAAPHSQLWELVMEELKELFQPEIKELARAAAGANDGGGST
jgi:hypothetical protein